MVCCIIFYSTYYTVCDMCYSQYCNTWMDHSSDNLYDRLPAVCSAASIQERLVEHSGQSYSSITGACSTVGMSQYRNTRSMDSIGWVYHSTTTSIFCCVRGIQTPFLVRNTSEMSGKVKKHLPVNATRVAWPKLQATETVL